MRVVRVDEDVGAGAHRGDGGVFERVVLLDGLHLHVVGDDDAVEADVVAEQVECRFRQARRQPGRRLGERLEIEVARHHHVDQTGRHQRAIGLEFGRRPGLGDVDEALVAVLAARAVPGEMLQRGQHAAGAVAAHECAGIGRYRFGVAGEAPAQRADDRVVGVDVDVDDRAEIDVEVPAPQIPRQPRVNGGRLGDRVRGGDIVGRRPLGEPDLLREPLDPAALLVDGDQHRRCAAGVENGLVERHHRSAAAGVTPQEEDAADLAGRDLPDKLCRPRVLGRRADEAHHDHLADHRFEVIVPVLHQAGGRWIGIGQAHGCGCHHDRRQ